VAKIEAVAEEAFTASDNATEMVFYLAADGAAASKMTLSSAGDLTLGGHLVIASSVPGSTTNKLYNDSGTLKFNGSTIGGGGTITALNNQAESRLVSIGSTTTELDGEANLTFDGSTLTLNGAYVNKAVPESDTPTDSTATLTLDLTDGNYFNIILSADLATIRLTNGTRGQKIILRLTQRADTAPYTVAWDDVEYSAGNDATVRWADGISPTMSTAYSHTDVYGFLVTDAAATKFDAFVIGQDLPN
jgi:hypothetical protein